ncbi:DNA cytosine methyltransferase [Facklamia sp. P12950]|uniref:DNA cytosine methyltransferase n=1 Tax=Facklamia sp. P12950 TaxID=3421951 RepID=UPI003D16FFB3
MNNLTLGSLFDGSGGFPLAAKVVGIKPIWASKIEPFPIRVTSKRMPEVRYLGDLCKIKGDEIEPVDIISFGSPCQDLSIAGKRGGLKGSQSNLFFEAIRIIKEMRWKTGGEKPRYIIWENVPGAFSSNQGEDFRRVLDEIISIKGAFPSVPMPYKNKWPYADLLMGEGFSLAYRVLDAKYFGVPQRRRRIFLVADFNGRCAG